MRAAERIGGADPEHPLRLQPAMAQNRLGLIDLGQDPLRPVEQQLPLFGQRQMPCAADDQLGIGALFALPISLANSYVGALDLYRHAPGPLLGNSLMGGLMAAELAALPLLEMLSAEADVGTAGEIEPAWNQLASLARVEVYQATGMVMAQLGVGPAEALARLRAYAFGNDQPLRQVAEAVVGRTLRFDARSGQEDRKP